MILSKILICKQPFSIHFISGRWQGKLVLKKVDLTRFSNEIGEGCYAILYCMQYMHVQKWRFRDRWQYVYLMVLVTQDFIAIQHGDKVSQLFVATSTTRRDNLLEKFMGLLSSSKVIACQIFCLEYNPEPPPEVLNRQDLNATIVCQLVLPCFFPLNIVLAGLICDDNTEMFHH